MKSFKIGLEPAMWFS